MNERNAYRLIVAATVVLLALTALAALRDGVPGGAVAGIVAFGALCLRFAQSGWRRGA